MTVLILGLLTFLGVHSTRVFAEGWRTATIARAGERPWKGIYAVISLLCAAQTAGTVYPAGTLRGTAICIVVGLAIYAAFLMGLHRWLIGVSPI